MYSLGVMVSSPFTEHLPALAIVPYALHNNCHHARQVSLSHTAVFSWGPSESEEAPCPAALGGLYVIREKDWSHWGQALAACVYASGSLWCDVHLGNSGCFFYCIFDIWHLRFLTRPL